MAAVMNFLQKHERTSEIVAECLTRRRTAIQELEAGMRVESHAVDDRGHFAPGCRLLPPTATCESARG
jgi:hypothetical protein